MNLTPEDVIPETIDTHLVLRFIHGLHLCEHQGDVRDSIDHFLSTAGVVIQHEPTGDGLYDALTQKGYAEDYTT